MKKILAGVLVLLASATAGFAVDLEMAVGIKGTVGMGKTLDGNLYLPSTMRDSINNSMYDLKDRFDGGFDLLYRCIWVFGGGNNKFFLGVQPEVGFTFVKSFYKSYYNQTLSPTFSPVQTYIGSTTGYFHLMNIPIMMSFGGRYKKFEYGLDFGPQVYVPLGKITVTAQYFDGANNNTLKKKFGTSAAVAFVWGTNLAYNITQHHGVFFNYRFETTADLSDGGGSLNEFDDSKKISVTTSRPVVLSLGYRYTF